MEYKVVLKLDTVERKSDGGILIPERIRDKELRARTTATIVAVGGSCFQDPDWNEPTPRVGDRVLIGRYVGEFYDKGPTDEAFQIVTDKEIIAIVDQERGEKPYHDSDQPDYAGDGAYTNIRSEPDVEV